MNDLKKNILFDLDGTLTDSKVGITGSISYALNKLKIEVPEKLDWCIGPPLQSSLAKLLGENNAKLFNEALKLYRERFEEKGIFENEVYPGIKELLGRLIQTKFKLFVATSKPEVYAKKIIKHFNLDQYFSGVYGSALSGVDSDKATIIKNILEKESISSSLSIMIGDRSHDLIGAKANNMDAIGVLWGYGSRAELKNENPYAIVKETKDLEIMMINWNKII